MNIKTFCMKSTYVFQIGHIMVWLAALTTLVSIHLVSTVFYQPGYQHDILIASLYACSHKIIMAAATGTILMACVLGHGGMLCILARVLSQKTVPAIQH
jgi:hypothetical protein